MIRQISLCTALLSACPVFAQSAADEFYDEDTMQAARDALRHGHGDAVTWMVLAERLEYDFDDDDLFVWEAQGWVGGDLNKVWFKTEGERSSDGLEEFELQALYSRAISPFWNLQAGVRYDFDPDPARAYGVFSLQGLAPHWVELDAALFVSETGDVSARLEAEYDLRIMQRLVLQPRLELNAAFSADEEIGVGSGLSSSEFGLRLRYEFSRQFAPYVGLSWAESHGETSKFTDEPDRSSIVLGIRFWF